MHRPDTNRGHPQIPEHHQHQPSDPLSIVISYKLQAISYKSISLSLSQLNFPYGLLRVSKNGRVKSKRIHVHVRIHAHDEWCTYVCSTSYPGTQVRVAMTYYGYMLHATCYTVVWTTCTGTGVLFLGLQLQCKLLFPFGIRTCASVWHQNVLPVVTRSLILQLLHTRNMAHLPIKLK